MIKELVETIRLETVLDKLRRKLLHLATVKVPLLLQVGNSGQNDARNGHSKHQGAKAEAHTAQPVIRMPAIARVSAMSTSASARNDG
jgi:hypothetical protein